MNKKTFIHCFFIILSFTLCRVSLFAAIHEANNYQSLEQAIIDANDDTDTSNIIKISQDITYNTMLRPLNANSDFSFAGKNITVLYPSKLKNWNFAKVSDPDSNSSK